jgi:nicotinamidase-related amidase
MHSAFFQTSLEILLRYLGASSPILCGLAANSRAAYMAHDANMRDFGLYVQSDCCIKRMADARVVASTSLRITRF